MLKTYLKYFVNLLWKPNRKAQTVYVSNTGSNQNFTYVTYIAPCDGYATLTASAYNNDSILHGGQIAFFIAKDADKIGNNDSSNAIRPFEISENFYADEFWKRNYLPVVKGDIITARVYCWNADMSTVNVSIEFMKKLGGGIQLPKIIPYGGKICLSNLVASLWKRFLKAKEDGFSIPPVSDRSQLLLVSFLMENGIRLRLVQTATFPIVAIHQAVSSVLVTAEQVFYKIQQLKQDTSYLYQKDKTFHTWLMEIQTLISYTLFQCKQNKIIAGGSLC